MLQEPNKDQELINFLFNAVNEQGYIFQDACEYTLRKNEEHTGWKVKATEYPVTFGEEFTRKDTSVDIILRAERFDSPELYALVECKRTEPSYVHWIFGAPYLPFGEPLFSSVGLQCSEIVRGSRPTINRLVQELHFDIQTYAGNNWLEAKRKQRNRTSTPQNIENAFIQVLRGIGGFTQEQLSQRFKSTELFNTFYLPVVITTAKLFVASYKSEDIDLQTGTISKDKLLFGPKGSPAEEQPWVVVDYSFSDDLPGVVGSMPTIPHKVTSVDPGELQGYKNRSIFIVNSGNLVPFFSNLKLKTTS